jgi:hypothetical protein
MAPIIGFGKSGNMPGRSAANPLRGLSSGVDLTSDNVAAGGERSWPGAGQTTTLTASSCLIFVNFTIRKPARN